MPLARNRLNAQINGANETELVVINDKQIKSIKDQYSLIGSKYMGKANNFNEMIKDLTIKHEKELTVIRHEQELMIKDNELMIKDKDNELIMKDKNNELMMKDKEMMAELHEKKLLQKDIEILNQRIELMEFKSKHKKSK